MSANQALLEEERRLAIAWLSLGRFTLASGGGYAARVQILKPVNAAEASVASTRVSRAASPFARK
jgi:hypothetical protein